MSRTKYTIPVSCNSRVQCRKTEKRMRNATRQEGVRNAQAGLKMKNLLQRRGRGGCIFKKAAKPLDKHFAIIRAAGADSIIIGPLVGKEQESAPDPPTQEVPQAR